MADATVPEAEVHEGPVEIYNPFSRVSIPTVMQGPFGDLDMRVFADGTLGIGIGPAPFRWAYWRPGKPVGLLQSFLDTALKLRSPTEEDRQRSKESLRGRVSEMLRSGGLPDSLQQPLRNWLIEDNLKEGPLERVE